MDNNPFHDVPEHELKLLALSKQIDIMKTFTRQNFMEWLFYKPADTPVTMNHPSPTYYISCIACQFFEEQNIGQFKRVSYEGDSASAEYGEILAKLDFPIFMVIKESKDKNGKDVYDYETVGQIQDLFADENPNQ